MQNDEDSQSLEDCDAEDAAISELVRDGFDRKTSRRIVRIVVHSVLNSNPEPVQISKGDLHALDKLAHEMNVLVWEMEEAPQKDQRRTLLGLIYRAKRVLKIARSYVTPEDGPKEL